MTFAEMLNPGGITGLPLDEKERALVSQASLMPFPTRIAFIGNWDPKKFLEMQRRNPQITPMEYEFIKANSRMFH